MAEILIIPRTSKDITVGGFHGNDGQRLVGVTFTMENGDHAVVALTVAAFRDYAELLTKAATSFTSDDYWAKVPLKG